MSVREKAKTHEVYPHSTSTYAYAVESGTSGKMYSVKYIFSEWHCDCRWGQLNRGDCSHVIAVRNYFLRKQDKPEEVKPEEPASKVKSIVVRPDGSIEVTYNL